MELLNWNFKNFKLASNFSSFKVTSAKVCIMGSLFTDALNANKESF